MLKVYRFLVLWVVFCLGGVAGAQDSHSCPTIVETALETVDQVCTQTGRNQACYGNFSLDVVAHPEVKPLKFDTPGDIVDVMDIDSLTLSPLDIAANEWGISLMQLQANLPDTLPGQNVTFLMFGDVDLQVVDAPPELTMTVMGAAAINVRSGPSTQHAVVAALPGGETIIANGRNEAGDWVRVTLPDGTGWGWVAVFLLETEEDITALSIVEADAPPAGALQAFYLQTGIGDAPCNAAPNSGVLIQTPEGVGSINLIINNVNIKLASTGYFQAKSGDVMRVSIVEGEAAVEALGEAQVAIAGTVLEVPIQDDLMVADVPTYAKAYNLDDLEALPTQHLPRPIEVSSSLEYVDLWTCELEGGNTVSAGAPLGVSIGVGRWRSIEGATLAMEYGSGYLNLDGVPMPFWRMGPVSDHSNGGNQYGYHIWFRIEPLEPGTYTIVGGNWQMDESPPNVHGGTIAFERHGSCTLTVD